MQQIRWPTAGARRAPPYFILIERALRDEGTSDHYLPPADFSHADRQLLEQLAGAFDGLRAPVHSGAVWTTDARFEKRRARFPR